MAIEEKGAIIATAGGMITPERKDFAHPARAELRANFVAT
jgi:hypothetical protein